MPTQTSIEWTGTPRADGTIEPGFTSNPLRYRDEAGREVWACVRRSPGCENCYAEAIALRFKKGGPFTVGATRKVTPYLNLKEVVRLLTDKKLAGKRVFIGDMTDVFGEWVSDEQLLALFAIFAARPDVTFQVLTKRADRMLLFLEELSQNPTPIHVRMHEALKAVMGYDHMHRPAINEGSTPWPLPNVWLGVSVENQLYANERVISLLRTPAAVRFLSVEPLLGAVDLTEIRFKDGDGDIRLNALTGETWVENSASPSAYDDNPDNPRIDWVITGGESGRGARRHHIEWTRKIVEQCKAASVACFVKQLGAVVIDRNDAGFEADHEVWAEGPDAGQPVNPTAWPTPADVEHDIDGHREEYQGAPVRIRLRSSKGGDMAEFPSDLRVRQWPTP